jgi:hypothetical protein
MAFIRKPPKGFIRISRMGAPAYVKPWFRELSERSQYEFVHGREAGFALCERAAEARHIETTYVLPLAAPVVEMKMAA